MKIKIEQTGKDVIAKSKIVVEYEGEKYTSRDNSFNFEFIAQKEILKIKEVDRLYLYNKVPTEIVFKNRAVLKVKTPTNFNVDTTQKMGDIVKQINGIAKQIKNIKKKVKAQLASTAVYEFEVEL